MLSCEQVEKFKMAKLHNKTELKEQETFIKNPKQVAEVLCSFNEDTQCGFGFIKGDWMQRLASKKTFLVINSITAMILSASYYYYSGTLTTLEKHYKFSSAQTGYIGASAEVVNVFASLIIPYYCAKDRLPRWIGFSVFCLAFAFFFNVLPFIIYGAGDDALSLTEEFGENFDSNSTDELKFQKKMKELCYANKTLNNCAEGSGNNMSLFAAISFVIASSLSGLGWSIYYTLSSVYIDDNVKKSKAPLMLCLSSFVRLLAPALGFSLASYSLTFYIVPTLHPNITDDDPRWIGAWWIGHVVLGISLVIMAPIVCTFPKTLPRAALRIKQQILKKMKSTQNQNVEEKTEASFQDLVECFKRLANNKTYVCNTMAAVFYVFGYIPFFMFQAKYIQIHFLFSPSTANLITGTVSLVCTAIGLLAAGIAITILKPCARYLAMWNILTSITSVIGIVAYGFFSCTSGNSIMSQNSQNVTSCNLDCNCGFVQYSPICGENNVTYISSCHAGCSDVVDVINGTNLFTNCRCITSSDNETLNGGSATLGACPLNCMPKFYMFFIFLCINKFFEGTEITANALMGFRCIEKRDKAVSMGLSSAVISILAVVPSPIFFGWIIDQCCLFWGKTCTSTGNCWLYDTEIMRYSLNMTAAVFILIGTLWDVGTWFYAKDVKIFDDDEDESETADKEVELEAENLKVLR